MGIGLRTVIHWLFFQFLFLSPFYLTAQATASPFKRLLPKPQEIKINHSTFHLTAEVKACFDQSSDSSSQLCLEIINQKIQDFGSTPLEKHQFSRFYPSSQSIMFIKLNTPAEIPFTLRQQGINWEDKMDAEGYLLVVLDSTVQVYARSQQGFYYGTLTLVQLISDYRGALYIPGVIIRDWPELKMRGITLDISRGQVPLMAHFKKIIRFLSQYKLNTFMLYLEDMFVFLKYPHIGMQRGALAPHDVEEIQQYARKYFVDIIPIFQTFGHFENILIQPRFQHLAEFPGAATLNCGLNETYHFLDDLLAEISPVFNSSYFHIGCDECWDVGKGANRNEKLVYGMASLLGNHFQRVIQMMRKHQKKIIMYGDMLLAYPDLLAEIPPDVIILDWQYHPSQHYSSVDFFTAAGRQVIVSPGLSNWRRLYPNYQDSFRNIAMLVRQAQKSHALGAVIASWGDFGGENLHELNWYGYAFAAECAWHSKPVFTRQFSQSYFENFYGQNDAQFDSLYFHLAELGAMNNLTDFWNFPFRSNYKETTEILIRIHKLQFHARMALKLIDSLAETVRKNSSHLQYLAFSARRGLILGRKLQYAHEIIRLSQLLTLDKKNRRMKNTIIAMCGTMIHELKRLKEQYQYLWSLENREHNLENILELYQHQIFYWEQKISQVKNGNYNENGELLSEWIYHAAPDSGKYKAYFRKSFHLPSPVHSFLIQTLGQSHLKIYFNGNFIGEQVARSSVSLIVEKQRVKLWDISKFAKTGENFISVEVNNYDNSKKAGLNLYGEIQPDNGTLVPILSDSSWMVTGHVKSGWPDHEPGEGVWVPAATKPSKWFITRPDFKNGILSRIEWR